MQDFQEYLTAIEKNEVPDVDVIIATPDIMVNWVSLERYLDQKV